MSALTCLLLLHLQLTLLVTSEEDDDGNGGVGGVGRREKHKLVEQRRREKTKELLVELQQARRPKPNLFLHSNLELTQLQLLPRPIDKNATMNTVLNETVKYLRDLRKSPCSTPNLLPSPSPTSALFFLFLSRHR